MALPVVAVNASCVAFLGRASGQRPPPLRSRRFAACDDGERSPLRVPTRAREEPASSSHEGDLVLDIRSCAGVTSRVQASIPVLVGVMFTVVAALAAAPSKLQK